jgi:hypothetical protein
MASVTPIRSGIMNTERAAMKRMVDAKPGSPEQIEAMTAYTRQGKPFIDDRGRTWNFTRKPRETGEDVYNRLTGLEKSRLPEPGPGDLEAFNRALNLKTGMSRAIAREILQQDTRLKLKPEELFMLKSGKGEPLDLMRKYYGRSMLNLDEWLDDFLPRTTLPPRDLASRVLNEVELIPQFAEGGLAEILQAPRSGMRIGGLGLLTRGLRTALKRTKKGYDVPGADFQVLMDDASYLMSPVNMQKIKKLELYRKQLVRDILRKEGGGKFMHGPQPEATRADLQLLDDYIAQLKNKIKEVGYYGQGAAEEKALLASRPDLPFSKFVKDKSRHAHGGLAGILEV